MMATALLHNRVIRMDGGLPDYEYSGEHALVEEEGGWKARFLTSGTLTPLEDMLVDVFCVGAGGAGGKGASTTTGGAGGAGGYTSTVKSVLLKKGIEYIVAIGDGGTAPGGAGGTTSFADIAEANGGGGGKSPQGGNGGSGGGRGQSGSAYAATSGGKDGKNGGSGTYCGTGQGTTTREFGESSGTLYASGGDGKNASGSNGAAGADNTGNGGGGCGQASSRTPGKGGSGIAIIRNAREVT